MNPRGARSLEAASVATLLVLLGTGCGEQDPGPWPPSRVPLPAPDSTVAGVLADLRPGGGHLDSTLANGLRVILTERPGNGLVASTVFVRAGAVRESEALNGAAHFLEHLLFNGTTSRSQETLYAEVDRIGAYNNASTREDYAVFMFLVGREHLEQGLDIQSDMLFFSTLPPEKFEKERGIVLEEIARDQASAAYAVGLAMDAALYAGTPYERPVLGTVASITDLAHRRVNDYYQRYYVPSNMVLFATGDFAIPEMIGILDRTFGRAAGSRRPAPPEPIPAISENRRSVRSVDDTARHLLIRIPAPALGDDDHAAIELLSDVLGNGAASRLRRAFTLEPRLEVIDVSSGVTLVGGRSFVDVGAKLSADADVDALAQRIAGEIARLAEHGVEPAELAAAQVGRQTEEASLRAQLHYYGFMRGPEILASPRGYMGEGLERYRRVTVDDVNRAAGRWFAAPPAMVIAVGPGLDRMDDSTTPESLGFVTPTGELPPYDGSASADRDQSRPVRRVTESRPPVGYQLENGLTVVVSSDPSSEVLAMHLMALGRSAQEPEGKDGVADLLHRLLPRGAGEWDRAAIGARIDAIGATVKTHDDDRIPYDDYYTAPSYSFVRFETLDEYYRDAIHLLGTMVTSPRLDESEFDEVRQEMRAIAEQVAGSPRHAATQAMRATLYGADSPMARAVVGTPESIDSITHGDLERFHRRYFAPSNLVLTVVTSVPAEDVLAEVREAFQFERARFEGDPAPWRAAEPRLAETPSEVRKTLGQSQSRVHLGYAFMVDPDDRPALDVAGRVLSDRMAFHLRERLGLAYSIGASYTSHGDRGVLSLAMGTRAENIETAGRELRAQVDSLAIAPIVADDVIRIVNARIGRMRMRRASRMGQAFYLSLDVLHGDPLLAHEADLRRLQDVSPADVRRVAEKYVAADRVNEVIVE